MRITTDARRGYWLVAITCKDRNKLLFDTVCTLADMQYDVFHATIDSQDGVAMQEYWIKASNGSIGESAGAKAFCLVFVRLLRQLRASTGSSHATAGTN